MREKIKAKYTGWRLDGDTPELHTKMTVKETEKAKVEGEEPTNKSFTSDPEFIAACARAGVEPTARQASKYRNGKGAAFNARNTT